MLSTVSAELLTPDLMSHVGYRAAFAVGLVLLGAPAFALGAVPTAAGILAVCLARGFGLGIVPVVGGALVAELVPPERRGEGLGLYGVAVGVPFAAGGLAPLVGLAAIPGLSGRARRPGRPVGVVVTLRTPALCGPIVVFFVVAMAAGIVITFVPLTVPGASGNLAATALLIQASAATFFRWWFGRLGDRPGPATLLVPAVVASAVGVLAPVFAANPVVLLAGMAIFGAGWGVSQNATLALMSTASRPRGTGRRAPCGTLHTTPDSGWAPPGSGRRPP